MSTPLNDASSGGSKTKPNRDRVILAVMLIIIGLLTFISQIVDVPSIELLILPGLALIFLIWGLLTREIGLIIPGGILAGVALGVYLIAGPFADLAEEDMAGVFMLGCVDIALLSPLTKQKFQWWPLIPGAIIGLVGLALVRGGAALQVLEIIGYAWPLVLVAIGAYLLLRRRG